MRTLVLPGLRCTALPLALIAAAGQPAFADDVIFDAEALSAQGLDAGLAGQFRQAARFPPGVSAVALFVNGESRGRLQVTFDSQGRLCPDTALLRQAGLKIPAGFPDASGGREDACRDLRAFWPQLSAIPSPADATLTLLVPQSALEPRTDNARWQHDGTAALLNYAAQLMGSRAPGSRMNYWQIQTELGFNAGDWIVRSNQNLYRFGQKAQTDYQNAYARRTFTGLKSTLQLGQIPLSGGLFGIGQVLGVQMTPEQALYGKNGSAVVAGVADTPSVVEIRQLGVPVFHTTVPAGPFSLSGFSLLNTRSDLSVTVTGADGGVRRYLVSAAAYARDGAVITPGISWGLGRYDLRGADKKPLLATAARGVQLSPRAALQLGGLWAENYQALGATLESVLPWRTSLSLQSTLARARRGDRRGFLNALTLTQPIGGSLSVNLSGSHQAAGYREFSEEQFSARGDYARNRDQYGAGVSWANALLGSLSVAAGRSTQTRGAPTGWAQISWGRQFGRVSLNLNAAHQQSGGRYGREDRLYLSLQMPLGDSTTVSSTANHGRGGNRYGMRLDQRLSQDRSWSLAAERDQGRGLSAATGAFSAVTRWSDLSGNLSADSASSRSLSLQASGSVVAHGHGVTPAPYQVRDTFGIARVGNKGGVRLETPAGPVWTDGGGYAVLPSLSGWSTSLIEVDTRSLGRRADVVNGTQEVMPARGAVSRVDFQTISSRRVLVSAGRANGQPLPRGAAVYDAQDNFITVVDEQGALFLPDARPGMEVTVDLAPGECRIRLDKLPDAPARERDLYETTTGLCR